MVVDNITKEVIKNEYMDLKEAFNESRVIIERCTPTEGNLLLLKFTVKAKTHYITSVNTTNPIETDEIVFYINVPNGYPKSKPLVYYPKDKMLASVNAFTSGNQCIDDWHFDEHNAGNNSNLLVVARKTIMDIIHNVDFPIVCINQRTCQRIDDVTVSSLRMDTLVISAS